jgi:hypothetical protein
MSPEIARKFETVANEVNIWKVSLPASGPGVV